MRVGRTGGGITAKTFAKFHPSSQCRWTRTNHVCSKLNKEEKLSKPNKVKARLLELSGNPDAAIAVTATTKLADLEIIEERNESKAGHLKAEIKSLRSEAEQARTQFESLLQEKTTALETLQQTWETERQRCVLNWFPRPTPNCERRKKRSSGRRAPWPRLKQDSAPSACGIPS
ncbi:hypothetical protein SBA7_880010 [Candidatus Sulfotelmatobacter sp. SbA7]|nr:hypothetical protein SBA7_880010 [Candidatus Sulfotelmatobacter sp. SbA7]